MVTGLHTVKRHLQDAAQVNRPEAQAVGAGVHGQVSLSRNWYYQLLSGSSASMQCMYITVLLHTFCHDPCPITLDVFTDPTSIDLSGTA